MFSIRRVLLNGRSFRNFVKQREFAACQCYAYSAQPNLQPIPEPAADGAEVIYPEKISRLADQIVGLSLVEVSELNSLLKKRLNIPDVPLMGGFVAAGPGVGAPQEEEEVEPQKVQTMFTLKLTKFDESKKVALIKEMKNQMEGMNLVQAKKFVEGAPQVVKADITKDEAESLKAALEAVGASCEIE